MTHLTATFTPEDQARAIRLLIAWLDGDRFAFDVVLTEAMDDPTGTPGLLFALTDFTARLGVQVAPDFRDQLRRILLAGDTE